MKDGGLSVISISVVDKVFASTIEGAIIRHEIVEQASRKPNQDPMITIITAF